MALTALGLFVAILSFWFYRYLNNRMVAFDRGMENASVGLVNCLVVHLERLGPPATNVHWARPPKSSIDYPLKGPRLITQRIYRYGVFELVWPRLNPNSMPIPFCMAACGSRSHTPSSAG
jgi:hypothetical protein